MGAEKLQPREPVKSTEVLPKSVEDEMSEADGSRDVIRETMAELGVSEKPNSFDDIKAEHNFKSDYDVFAYLISSFANKCDPKHMPEIFSAIRMVIGNHERGEELTSAAMLAWHDFHYQEEPSKLLATLDLMGGVTLPTGNQRISLVLSLLHSGYTSNDSIEDLKTVTEEILKRRAEFSDRIIAGEGVQMISLEDSDSFSPRRFTDLASDIGTEVRIINSDLEKDFKEAFLSEIMGHAIFSMNKFS